MKARWQAYSLEAGSNRVYHPSGSHLDGIVDIDVFAWLRRISTVASTTGSKQGELRHNQSNEHKTQKHCYVSIRYHCITTDAPIRKACLLLYYRYSGVLIGEGNSIFSC